MISDPITADYTGEAEEFNRLCTRVLRGRHLPTFPEFLQGVPFFKNDIAFDADVFARRFLAMLSRESDPDGNLSLALARLTASHDIGSFKTTALAFTASIQNEAVIIAKASTSRHNGALLDCLLSLWEPRTAQAWRDPYVEAAVDLSHVCWLGTANDLEGVPRPIRDRARVLPFPALGPAHVRTLAFYLMRNLAHGDPRWVRPLDESEASALEKTWTDGSLRSLARLLKSVIDTRERYDVRH